MWKARSSLSRENESICANMGANYREFTCMPLLLILVFLIWALLQVRNKGCGCGHYCTHYGQKWIRTEKELGTERISPKIGVRGRYKETGREQGSEKKRSTVRHAEYEKHLKNRKGKSRYDNKRHTTDHTVR